MRYVGGRLNWYDVPFIAVATVIVFPDRILDWIGEHTGRVFTLRHIIWLEVLAIGSMMILTTLLAPHYPKIQEWYPLAIVGIMVVFRLIWSLLVGMFGADD